MRADDTIVFLVQRVERDAIDGRMVLLFDSNATVVEHWLNSLWIAFSY